jgi:hypothetical protein
MVSLLLLIPGSPAWGQAAESPPDPAALARAGQETLRRLRTESASWTVQTVQNETPGGIRFIAEVESTAQARRIVLSGEREGQRAELARVIRRDGAWYVTQPEKAGKYRPYEAPLDAPTAYIYLARSDLFVVSEDHVAGVGTYEGTEAGIATYRRQLEISP